MKLNIDLHYSILNWLFDVLYSKEQGIIVGGIFIKGCAAFPCKTTLSLHVCFTSSQKMK